MDRPRIRIPMKRKKTPWLLLSFAFVVMFCFFFRPLLTVLSKAAGSPIGEIFEDSFFWRVCLFTYTQAFFSAILSALLGVVGAFLFAAARGRSRRYWSA